MLILSMLAQEILTLERYAISNTYVGDSGAAPSHACEIAEQVIGRIAWDRFKNTEIQAMKELRKPMPRGTLGPYRAKRNKQKDRWVLDWVDVGDWAEIFWRCWHSVDYEWYTHMAVTGWRPCRHVFRDIATRHFRGILGTQNWAEGRQDHRSQTGSSSKEQRQRNYRGTMVDRQECE